MFVPCIFRSVVSENTSKRKYIRAFSQLQKTRKKCFPSDYTNTAPLSHHSPTPAAACEAFELRLVIHTAAEGGSLVLRAKRTHPRVDRLNMKCIVIVASPERRRKILARYTLIDAVVVSSRVHRLNFLYFVLAASQKRVLFVFLLWCRWIIYVRATQRQREEKSSLGLVNCMEVHHSRIFKQLMYVCLVPALRRAGAFKCVRIASSPTYTGLCLHNAEHTLFVYILHLSGYLKKKRSHCVLYATKRQFQNKSQLGRICKLHVSRKIIGFKYFLNIFTVRPHRKSFQLFKLYRNIKNRRRVFRKISVFFECFGDFFLVRKT